MRDLRSVCTEHVCKPNILHFSGRPTVKFADVSLNTRIFPVLNLHRNGIPVIINFHIRAYT
jgi:hypothetical protein